MMLRLNFSYLIIAIILTFGFCTLTINLFLEPINSNYFQDNENKYNVFQPPYIRLKPRGIETGGNSSGSITGSPISSTPSSTGNDPSPPLSSPSPSTAPSPSVSPSSSPSPKPEQPSATPSPSPSRPNESPSPALPPSSSPSPTPIPPSVPTIIIITEISPNIKTTRKPGPSSFPDPYSTLKSSSIFEIEDKTKLGIAQPTTTPIYDDGNKTEDNGKLSPTVLIGISIGASSIFVMVIAVIVIRKLKLRPSNDFRNRLNGREIDFGPTASPFDDRLDLPRQAPRLNDPSLSQPQPLAAFMTSSPSMERKNMMGDFINVNHGSLSEDGNLFENSLGGSQGDGHHHSVNTYISDVYGNPITGYLHRVKTLDRMNNNSSPPAIIYTSSPGPHQIIQMVPMNHACVSGEGEVAAVEYYPYPAPGMDSHLYNNIYAGEYTDDGNGDVNHSLSVEQNIQEEDVLQTPQKTYYIVSNMEPNDAELFMNDEEHEGKEEQQLESVKE